jgi:hypothetical protein
MNRGIVWMLWATTVGCLWWVIPVAGAESPPGLDLKTGSGNVARANFLGPSLNLGAASDTGGPEKPLAVTLPAGNVPGEHPLMPAIRWALEGLPTIEGLQDYTAVLAKREQIDGELGDYEYLSVKIRHRPFSVYIRFLDPPALKGQEAVYVQGRNDGAIWAHRGPVLGTLRLDPRGALAMRGHRYPITEIGMANLIRRLVEVARHDVQYGECEVKFLAGAKINDRPCTLLQVVHPVPRREFRFYLARIFVDEELKLPVRYESYDWPLQPGGQPRLIEEYTYLNLKVNTGLTDWDFDIANPQYRFPRNP